MTLVENAEVLEKWSVPTVPLTVDTRREEALATISKIYIEGARCVTALLTQRRMSVGEFNMSTHVKSATAQRKLIPSVQVAMARVTTHNLGSKRRPLN